jgi:antirestriction protein ArdC
VVLVALEEDPSVRLVGNLLARADGGIDEFDPADIRIGEPVRVHFDPVSDTIHLPRWLRVEENR